ncbi:fused MFS/spermidine synthase [Actinoplanes oblitus]|uniref:Fused MFS/spermidine synthase n=1 Tax=Actinoplanes oblitus TaxID=3040509 RepID=A0ABY8W881_9ACTN|nr:fused MFS/spermidine synthase [Actinoplanes oblitus]WIM93878.1 fused MFS/spermidine synthase [Actinoplanes oblitus]
MATHGNRRTPGQAGQPPPGNRRAPDEHRLTPDERLARVAAVASGAAELVPDPRRPRGWTLLVNGVPQSYVDLADPEHLEFPYVRQIARGLRAWARSAVPESVLHLGGGGLTVPRLVARWWPGAAQVVVELDADLVTMVTRELPPERPPEIVVGDAREAVERAGTGRYDVIVADVFAGAAMPEHLGTVEFVTQLRRVLRPGGLLIMNVTDVPPMAFTRIQVATVAAAFADVGLLGDQAVLRGRRAGNVIVFAGRVPPLRTSRDERLLREGELVVFSGGARPRMDAKR